MTAILSRDRAEERNNRTFYQPTDRRFEQEVRRRLAEWRKRWDTDP